MYPSVAAGVIAGGWTTLYFIGRLPLRKSQYKHGTRNRQAISVSSRPRVEHFNTDVRLGSADLKSLGCDFGPKRFLASAFPLT
jgi:hypothetical protein